MVIFFNISKYITEQSVLYIYIYINWDKYAVCVCFGCDCVGDRKREMS